MKMDLEKMEQQLSNCGFCARLKPVEIIKNGNPYTGIRVTDPTSQSAVSPIVYYTSTDSTESILDRILDVLHMDSPVIDIQQVCDAGIFVENVYLGIVRRGGSQDNAASKPYLNVDLVLRLSVRDQMDDTMIGSIQVTNDLLAAIGVSEDDAWEHAVHNTQASSQIVSMCEILGLPDNVDMPLFVAMANDGRDGSAVIYISSIFHDFCQDHGWRSLWILPSSTQELIVIPGDTDMAIPDLLQINREITQMLVDDLIALDYAVYQYDLAADAVRIAALER